MLKCIVLCGEQSFQSLDILMLLPFNCSSDIKIKEWRTYTIKNISTTSLFLFFICGDSQFVGKLAEICLLCYAKQVHLVCRSLWYCCQYWAQYSSEIPNSQTKNIILQVLTACDFFLFFKLHNFSFFPNPSYLFLDHYNLDFPVREEAKRLRLNTFTYYYHYIIISKRMFLCLQIKKEIAIKRVIFV